MLKVRLESAKELLLAVSWPPRVDLDGVAAAVGDGEAVVRGGHRPAGVTSIVAAPLKRHCVARGKLSDPPSVIVWYVAIRTLTLGPTFKEAPAPIVKPAGKT